VLLPVSVLRQLMRRASLGINSIFGIRTSLVRSACHWSMERSELRRCERSRRLTSVRPLPSTCGPRRNAAVECICTQCCGFVVLLVVEVHSLQCCPFPPDRVAAVSLFHADFISRGGVHFGAVPCQTVKTGPQTVSTNLTLNLNLTRTLTLTQPNPNPNP